MPAQANGTGRRQCTPSVAIGLLMAPLAVWFALDYLQITPRPEPPKIVANPEAAKLMAAPEASPPPLPSPPPPKPLEDWQLALNGANATGLAPPVFHGNWRQAAAARMRWFALDGSPRSDRPEPGWWAYPDPAPPDLGKKLAEVAKKVKEREKAEAAEAAAAKKGGKAAEKAAKPGGRVARKAGGSSGGSQKAGGSPKRAAPKPKAKPAAATEASNTGTSGSGSANTDGGSNSAEDAGATQTAARRRLAAKDSKKAGGAKKGGTGKSPKASAAETWAASEPPLQGRGANTAAGQEERSYYIDFIYKDLEPWQKHGITAEDVQRAWDLAAPRPAGPYCYGDQIHFQIVDGRLYVDYQTNNKKMPGVDTREVEGWYPGTLGPGLTTAKGHMPYVLFTLLDVLRAFPGEVPDVSVVLHTSDYPCLKANHSVADIEFRQPDTVLPDEHWNGRPIPVMGYNRKEGFLDLMFPDFTYYGHEYSQIVDPDGKMINGWPQQADVLVAMHALRPLEARKPTIMWRGRATDEPRDTIRRRFQGCPNDLEKAGHKGAKELFDVVAPPVHEITSTRLMDNGEFRYPVYIDAGAYSSSLKDKLAVGSPLLMIKHRYEEWYTRALMPGVTHISIPDDESMCNATWDKVQLMEAMINDHAEAVRAAGHLPPALQQFAANWSHMPWGGIAESYLRQWTLASRGIAAGGHNAYEDSDMYVVPPPPLEDFTSSSGYRMTAADLASKAEDAAAAAPAPAPQSRGGSRAASWIWALVLGSGARSEKQEVDVKAQRQALLAARERIGARREWAALHRAAEKARQAWERKQDKLKRALPWDIWSQAEPAWGTGMLPWEIAAAGQLFVRDRLRIRDVRLYVKDLLLEYHRLQKFSVRPTRRARCIDWERMLEEFAWPHYKDDLDQLLFFYPYLRQPFSYNCSTDPHEQNRAPYTPGHDGAGDWDKEEAYQAALRKDRDEAEPASDAERDGPETPAEQAGDPPGGENQQQAGAGAGQQQSGSSSGGEQEATGDESGSQRQQSDAGQQQGSGSDQPSGDQSGGGQQAAADAGAQSDRQQQPADQSGGGQQSDEQAAEGQRQPSGASAAGGGGDNGGQQSGGEQAEGQQR